MQKNATFKDAVSLHYSEILANKNYMYTVQAFLLHNPGFSIRAAAGLTHQLIIISLEFATYLIENFSK